MCYNPKERMLGMKFKLQKGYLGNLLLSEKFVRELMPELSDQALRAYLAVLMHCQNKSDCELGLLAESLGMETDQLIDVFRELENKSLIKVSTTGVTLLALTKDELFASSSTRQYTPEEIEALDDKDVKALIHSAEKSFGKLLSHGEVNGLIGLYHWLGLPVGVLSILIEYVVSTGKKSMGYIEKVAIDWADKEINTPKKAHEHIRLLEQQKTEFEQMKSLLGIYGRNLTKREKEFITKWKLVYSDEMIKEAYEKTIDSTGKISFAYTDKILKSAGEEKPGEKKMEMVKPVQKAVKSSKFHNFTQAPPDFDELEKAALNKLIKRAGKEKENGVS